MILSNNTGTLTGFVENVQRVRKLIARRLQNEETFMTRKKINCKEQGCKFVTYEQQRLELHTKRVHLGNLDEDGLEIPVRKRRAPMKKGQQVCKQLLLSIQYAGYGYTNAK